MVTNPEAVAVPMFGLALCLLALLLAPVPAFGQQADPIAADQPIEEIFVTGSRIKRRDYSSASPITTVDTSLFDQSGSPTVESMLNRLPQFVPGYTEYANNRGGSGFSTYPGPGQAVMDLRGLGVGRSLVLLDGRRIVPSSPYGSVDVSLIPPAIIQNVEIITGGASAVYGTDAIAGVINFKTRKFTGIEVEAGWQHTDSGDGSGWHTGITGGLDYSRGYAFGYLGYTERDPVLAGQRKFSSVAVGYNPDAQEFEPLGSSVIRQGRWDHLFDNLPTQAAIDTYFSGVDPRYVPGAVSQTTPMGFNPDGSPFSVSPVYNFTGDANEPLQPVNADRYTYNYAPVNFLRLPMERTNFFGRTGLFVGDGSEIYLQALGANYSPDIKLASTPMFNTYIGAANPFIQSDLAALLASRLDPNELFRFRKRMTDAGPRAARTDYDVLQVLTGIKGDLAPTDSWDYDIYASFGRVEQTTVQQGNVSRTAFEELSIAPDAGAAICGGQGMNPFGINSISPECAAHISRDSVSLTSVKQIIGEATISGPLFNLPAGEVQTAIGLFYKEDDFDFNPDETLSATRIDPIFDEEVADISGFNSRVPIAGNVDSKEIYFEANFPLLANTKFAESLELAVGYRYAQHSNSGTIDAYKVEGIWQVAAPLMLRGSFQHAVRAPDFVALFEPQVSILSDIIRYGEPCESDYDDEFGDILGAQQDPEVAALCIAQSIPANVLPTYVDTDKTIETIHGGDPTIEEEIADTHTFGIVLQSPWNGWASGLRASLDYYRIEMSEVIGPVDWPEYRCYDRQFNPTLDPGNFYCQRFQRDATTYEIYDVLKTTTNIAAVTTSGYDLQLDYATDAGAGQLRLHAIANYLSGAQSQGALGDVAVEHSGRATNQELFTLAPRWKLAADTTYLLGGFDGSLHWRYVDSMTDDWIEEFTLPSRQYLDLTLGYYFDSGSLEGLAVRVGATNLSDTQPVIYPSSPESNTDPSSYDVLGRRYFVRATYTF